MESIKAHVFTTETEAKNAIDLINKSEGIPVSEDSTTTTYTEYKEENGVFYILADDITVKYLDTPTDYEPIEFEL
jgi:hypothetical protein